MWREGGSGPACDCGQETVVMRHPDGRLLMVCVFHPGESGSYTVLDEEES